MLPIGLNPSHITIVIFGYGRASQIKIQGIIRAGAKCIVISPDVEARNEGQLIFESDEYSPEHLEKGQLIIAATGSPILNHQIALDARMQGKLVLNLSDGEQSDFHMMSWRTSGPVTVGLSTGSCAPKESKRLIESLMDVIDEETVDRIVVLGELRKKIKGLGYSPIKPIINKLVAYSLQDLEALNELSSLAFSIEIKKLV